jgi:lipopolysaccharide export system protein LptA
MFAWTWCLLLNVGVCSVVHLAQAAEPPGPKPASVEPVSSTTITSRTMTVNNHENTAIFDGSVVLTRGPLIVHSDHMVVTFNASGNGAMAPANQSVSKPAAGLGENKQATKGREATPTVSDRSIRTLEATGRVRIEKEDGRATCRKAVYIEAEKKIILTGEPVAWQKGTRVSGKRIIMFVEEDRSIVEGDSRVIIEGEGGSMR